MVTALVIFLALVVAAFVYVFLRMQRLKNKLRQTEEMLAHRQQDWEDKIAGRQVEFLEQELQRIGADIHDELIQRLCEQILYIEQLTWVEDIDKAQALALKLKSNYKMVVNSVREISARLLPSSIDSPSMVTAMMDLKTRIELPGVARIAVNSHGTEFQVDVLHQAHLVRIVQELVHNATKHTPCWHVWIRLKWSNHFVIIEVEDDGLRRNEAMMNLQASTPFRTIRMRLRFIGATLMFEKGENGLRAVITYPGSRQQ